MSFKSLEDRFNEKVNDLYAGAKNKFDNGKPTNGRTDAPLIVREPGKGYWSRIEDRALPIQSTAQDLKRLTLFQLSPNGLKFLAKQQLLQTGNTFEFTRTINPAFVVGNTVPFLHIKRNLRPLTELVGKTDVSDANTRTLGQLQFGTYNKLKSKSLSPFILQEFFGKDTTSRGFLNNLTKSLLAPLESLKDTITDTLSAYNPNQKRNVGEIKDKWGKESWPLSRPELVTYVKEMQKGLLTKYQINALNDTKKTSVLNPQSTKDNFVNRFELIPSQEKVIRFIKYFDAGQSLATGAPGTDKPNSYIPKRGVGYISEQAPKNISYIKDPSNKKNTKPSTQKKVSIPYKPIPNNFEDPITVSFAIGNQEHIKFRAFIKDLIETTTPQYTPYQYVGRVEKFINYTGVQREISFKLAILAFGQDELDVVWRRINYITGLAFPYGFTKGMLQPNITRLTIGNLYINQPGYITTLTTNFNEPAGSWDIDKQIPIGAMVDMRFVLIEKSTKIAESPFYGYTEDKLDISVQNFSKTIQIPKKVQQSQQSVKINVNKETQNELDLADLGIEGRPLPSNG